MHLTCQETITSNDPLELSKVTFGEVVAISTQNAWSAHTIISGAIWPGVHGSIIYITVFPRSDAMATINFPLLALAATIRGRCLLKGGVNYTLHDSLLFSSINFDYVMFTSTIFGNDYC